MDKEDFNSRRTSAPIVSNNLPEENNSIFRSLRTENRTKIKNSPDIYVIPEIENEVEGRPNQHKLPVRPISADSLRVIHYTKSENSNHNPHQHSLHSTHSFGGSHNHIHRSTSTLHSSTSVVREQYCSLFKNWTKREKVLITIIAFLLFFVCGLLTAVGVLIEKHGGNETDSMWFSLRL